jgi:hypothetical protein
VTSLRRADRLGRSGRELAVTLLIAFSVLFGAARAVTAQQRWQGFERVLWIGDPGRVGAAFWQGVRDLGFTAVALSRGVDPAPARAAGLRHYVDQVAGKGILELRDAEWQPLFERYLAERDESALRRPSCLADPDVVDELRARVRAGLAGASGSGAIGASLGDEASATRRSNPLDICASPTFRAAFRSAISAQAGGDVAALNLRWGTSYRDFAAVEPWTTGQMRARELVGPGLPSNLSPWNDQLAFCDQLFAVSVSAAAAAAADAVPGLPVGLTGMQAPTAFGGHDVAALMPSMGFYEAYHLVGLRDLCRAFARPGALEVATLFGCSPEEEAVRLRGELGSLIAHGVDGVIVYQGRDVCGSDGSPTAYGESVAAAFARLEPAMKACASRVEVRDRDVLLVESRPSVRAHWMIDSWEDGRTWPKRLSSYEARHGTSSQARQSWVEILDDLGVTADFVDSRRLAERLRIAPPRLLVLPAILALSDADAAAVRAFVRDGGHVLADHGTGIYDDDLRLRDAGVLDALFGVSTRSLRRDDHSVRNASVGERARLRSGVGIAEPLTEGVFGEVVETAGTKPRVQLEARAGRGRTTYLNLAVTEYAGLRLDPARVAAARDLRRRVRRALDAAEVLPSVVVRGEGLPTCIERVRLVSSSGTQVVAVRLDCLGAAAVVDVLRRAGPRQVEIAIAGAERVRDVLRGVELELEDGWFRAELDVFEPLFLEVLGP